jgi:lauroyl/myristoyl acyltransferase
MIAVARVMNNKFVARWMKKHHFRGPVTIIDKKNGFSPDVLRQWADTAAAMTILMDQHTAGGAKLQFLGRPARTFTSATRLAMRSGRRIVVGSFVRVGPYRYKLVGGPPVSFAKDADRDASTQILNDRLGAVIRKYPEQYLWAHRRWRDD